MKFFPESEFGTVGIDDLLDSLWPWNKAILEDVFHGRDRIGMAEVLTLNLSAGDRIMIACRKELAPLGFFRRFALGLAQRSLLKINAPEYDQESKSLQDIVSAIYRFATGDVPEFYTASDYLPGLRSGIETAKNIGDQAQERRDPLLKHVAECVRQAARFCLKDSFSALSLCRVSAALASRGHKAEMFLPVEFSEKGLDLEMEWTLEMLELFSLLESHHPAHYETWLDRERRRVADQEARADSLPLV